VDWNIRTPWHSAASDTNASWSVDLGAAYVLQRIEIVARIDLNDPVARSSFQVQASNSSTFTTYTVIAEQSSVPFAYKQTNLRNSWIKYVNNPNGYRYLRVKKTNTAALGIEEFRAFGFAAPSTPGKLVWDAGATGSITDGSGQWNAPDQWWNGNANQTWADNNDVVIGNGSGAAGTITITGASPQLNSLTFNTASNGSYILTGAALQLNGTGSTTAVTTDANATVNNNVSTTGAFVKAGAAALTLAGTNTFAGDLTVNAGTLSLSTATLAASGAVNLSTGALLNLNFTGTKNITTLRINGLVQAPGTWGSLASTATHKTALITGTGLLDMTGPQPPYDAWALAAGLDNSTIAKDATLTADPEGDGVSNLMEYATHMNPALHDTLPVAVVKNGGNLDFTYNKNKAATDVTFVVEWSDTLNGTDWSTVGVGTPVILADDGVTQQIKVTVAAGSGVARRFVHLKVTRP
jgi:autotransporter-associated beta strand protein